MNVNQWKTQELRKQVSFRSAGCTEWYDTGFKVSCCETKVVQREETESTDEKSCASQSNTDKWPLKNRWGKSGQSETKQMTKNFSQNLKISGKKKTR